MSQNDPQLSYFSDGVARLRQDLALDRKSVV